MGDGRAGSNSQDTDINISQCAAHVGMWRWGEPKNKLETDEAGEVGVL